MSIVVIKGDDQILVAQAVQKAVNELLDGGDRSLMTEEVAEAEFLANGSDPDIGPLVVALTTPPFLTDRRIIIARNLALFSKAAQVEPLVTTLNDQMDGIDAVLVWEKGSSSNRLATVPKKLKDCFVSNGAQIVQAAPSGKGRKMLLKERLDSAPLRLDARAKSLIANVLGDDVGRVDGIIETLISSFGEGSELTDSDVQPLVGASSDVPPWDLTDAIDSGDIPLALTNLKRMVVGGERHSLQILATLSNHYQRAFALDGAAVMDERGAADFLGMKGSTFPAKKALTLSKKLGSAKLRKIITLLVEADVDVRGRTAAPPEQTVEVLVARLAQLNR